MELGSYNLNENQRTAVEWQDGPLLVLAGPGSGKTLVLTLRAARLLTSDEDASVLALTFTSKAADEMRERLDRMMGKRADRVHLCTFHSFASDVLRQHGSHIGLSPSFSLLTLDEDRIAIAEEAISQLSADASALPSDRKNLLTFLDRLFAEGYDGEEGLAPWVSEFFKLYCATLQKRNRLDYGGLLHFARKLLSGNAGVARVTRLAWQFVCVDEFQDTNRAQYDLLRCVVPTDSPNLFVVADDDQIIYQWNGASPERMQALKEDYKMSVVQLPENYRCPKNIIRMANRLIAHNKLRTPDKQPLISHKPTEETPTLKARSYMDEGAELAGLGNTITEHGWNPSECAVIGRTVKQLERAAARLNEDGFATYVAQRKTEFESAATRWMYSVLRLANARHDRDYLRRTCVAWFDLTEVLMESNEVEAVAALHGGDFLRAWISEAQKKGGKQPFMDLLTQVKENILDRLNFIDLVEWYWGQAWIDDPNSEEEVGTWRELHEALLREYSRESLTLHHYLQEMDLKSKASPRPPLSIPCLTVHGAKGLEFKHVFLIGMAEGVFPSVHAMRKGDDSREMEEERRNCFVAITRVQESLHISYARSYNGYSKEPSRFLKEMGFVFKKPEA